MAVVKDIERPRENFANEDTLAVAGTAQLLANGAEDSTFAKEVNMLTITYCDLAVYIAKSEAEAGSAAAGDEDDRIYIPAGTIGFSIPWEGDSVYFINAAGVETPFIAVIGHRP